VYDIISSKCSWNALSSSCLTTKTQQHKKTIRKMHTVINWFSGKLVKLAPPMTDCNAKMHQIRFPLGLKGPTSKGRRDGGGFLTWRGAFKMAAVTSFHAKNCCHLVSTHVASAQCICSSVRQSLSSVHSHLFCLRDSVCRMLFATINFGWMRWKNDDKRRRRRRCMTGWMAGILSRHSTSVFCICVWAVNTAELFDRLTARHTA